MFSLCTLLAFAPLAVVLAAPLEGSPPSFAKRSCDGNCGQLDLSHQLVDAPTAVDRFKLLNSSMNNFVFNFLDNHGTPEGPDGRIILASAANFPATIGNGVAMGVGFLGPCGLNVPHLHPRAAELNIALGGDLVYGQLQEDGTTFVTGTLKDHEATVFPQGAIHFEQNLGCKPAQFVAAFGSADPGRLDIAPAFFQDLPTQIIDASLGGIGVKEIASIAHKIPMNVAFGTQQCLDRCKIERPGMWTESAIAHAKAQFQEFLDQSPLSPSDFRGLLEFY